VDAYTTRVTPHSFAASSTLMNPSTLTLFDVTGSSIERGTDPSAA
jgi:hypothetical protein